MKIGGVEITKPTVSKSRMSMLIWGPSGSGKTTLACTLPGKKLLILFDPDGGSSINSRDDIDIVDLSTMSNSNVIVFKSQTDPLSLGQAMQHYDSFIIDSLTNAQHKTTMHAVETTKGATIERVSPGGYATRNALIIQLIKNVLALTSKHQKHVAFIAHEDSPVTNDEGNIMHITMSLGGKLPDQAAVDFSEVWYLGDYNNGAEKRIMIRSARSRKPMKTRMFITNGEPEFKWVYDPNTHTGMQISDWYDKWVNNNGQKIPLPTK
jgi:phage nucleotide-binding protein